MTISLKVATPATAVVVCVPETMPPEPLATEMVTLPPNPVAMFPNSSWTSHWNVGIVMPASVVVGGTEKSR